VRDVRRHVFTLKRGVDLRPLAGHFVPELRWYGVRLLRPISAEFLERLGVHLKAVGDGLAQAREKLDLVLAQSRQRSLAEIDKAFRDLGSIH